MGSDRAIVREWETLCRTAKLHLDRVLVATDAQFTHTGRASSAHDECMRPVVCLRQRADLTIKSRD
jgi:hypothetical protein